MECRVLFDYKAGEDDELDLKKGDLVTEIVSGGELEEGWWSGVSNGKRGVFPNNFVDTVPVHAPTTNNSTGHAAPKYSAPQSDPALRTGVNRVQRAKVTFSYKPVNSDELRLEVGDVVEIFTQVEDGWLSGCNKGSRGVFPSNFVEFMDESQPPIETQPQTMPSRELKNKVPIGGIALPILPMQGGKPSEDALKAKKPAAPQEKAKVVFSYEPQEEDELKLEVGEIVDVVNKEHAEGWWEGRINGKTGVFPNNFVELIPEKSLLQKAILKPNHPARTEPDSEQPSIPRKSSLKGAPATAPKRSGPTNELQRKLDRRNKLNTGPDFGPIPTDNGQTVVPGQAARTMQEEHVPAEELKAPPRRPSGPKGMETAETRGRQIDPSELEPIKSELSEAKKELSDVRRELTKLKQEYREDFDRMSDESREEKKLLAELRIEVESLKKRRADYWNPEKFF